MFLVGSEMFHVEHTFLFASEEGCAIIPSGRNGMSNEPCHRSLKPEGGGG